MYTHFPILKKLTIEDKELIEQFTSKHPPYSDFYFFSLWIYNVSNNIEFYLYWIIGLFEYLMIG